MLEGTTVSAAWQARRLNVGGFGLGQAGLGREHFPFGWWHSRHDENPYGKIILQQKLAAVK